MLKHPAITLKRFTRFASELKALLHPDHAPLAKLSVFSAPGRISFAEAMKGKYRPAKEGERFGPDWSTHWFKIEYVIPKDWRGEKVLLHFDSGSESCVWKDGVPLQGLANCRLTPTSIRSYFTLAPRCRGGERGTLYVETAINGLFGLCDAYGWGMADHLGILENARLVTQDQAVWDLLWDFVTIQEMAETLPVEGPDQGRALAAANEITNAVTLEDPKSYAKGREIARRFFETRNGTRNHHVSAIGHAHIDTAWLWPLAETKRKCYRTFSTAVRMMDDYPDYKFVCSQAQQLAWIKDYQPKLYAKIKAKVKTGQFIPAGGAWIEPDCNIPSGESLVRQFLVGQRFYQREFGEICREFWNPDVFGYSGALPQIMRGVGIRFFLTQKLSWNQFNKPTSSTFLWEGIDGSRVLTHFPPTDTYNANASVPQMLMHYTGFKDKERAGESYMLFGFGDGGGGPTEEMVERLARMKNLQGLPEVEMRSPREFFDRCEKDIVDPLVWSGELYFETHRGTYTTQAANKRDNRRSEELLHDIEFLAAIAAVSKKKSYPQAELARLWEIVLLNQFHDIIPGSSITEVYQDSAKHYADVLDSAGKLRAEVATRVVAGVAKNSGPRFAALNTLSWPRREVVELPGKKRLSFAQAPAYGYAVAEPATETPQPVSFRKTARGFVLENALVRATFDAQGRLTSFFDLRHQRETIAAQGKGNQFVLFEDLPVGSDAWDVDIFHLEKRRDVGQVRGMRVIEQDPLRATVELDIEISPKAKLRQRITLEAESPRLNFACEVDWAEKNQFLKVEFPLALRSEYATYEIQFGHVRRPTHFNTSWDMARFEVSAHRWADLSEPNFGVALINDSKYGYSCLGNLLTLCLLRSPKTPDPLADMGKHHFRYALYPHEGGPQLAGVVAQAAAFNQPLQVFPSTAEAGSVSYFSLDNPAIVLDTVKKAEDSGHLILRLYESHGAHQTGVLTSSLRVRQVTKTDLLEQPEKGTIKSSGHRIPLSLRPFELITLKLEI